MEMEESFGRIALVSPVTIDDRDPLAVLFGQHNTINGTPEKVDAIIEDSRRGFEQGGHRLTLVARKLMRAGEKSELKLVASGSMMGRKHANEREAIPMYVETHGGLDLHWSDEDYLELGGMIADQHEQGRVYGKAITTVRAIIARKFQGVLGYDDIISEFLPPLDKKGTGLSSGNAFWREIIYNHLQEVGAVEKIAMISAEALRGDRVGFGEDELYDVLTRRLDTPVQNQIIREYFPKQIPENTLRRPEISSVLENFGGRTKGAMINLERVYPGFRRVGWYPVDGGQNWVGQAEFGALGDRTVELVVLDNNSSMEVLTNPGTQCAVISRPLSGSRENLRTFRTVVTPGLFGNRVAKIPQHAVELLIHGGNDIQEIMYRLIPTKSSQRLTRSSP